MTNSRDSFSKFLVLSIGFHAVIFIFLTVKVLFFPSEPPKYTQAVRVDVVALPEKNVTPPKPAVKKEEPKPIAKIDEPKVKPKPEKPKPKKKIVEKAKPKKPKVAKKKEKPEEEVLKEQDSALARLKAMQKLKDQQAKSEKQEFKGNAISKGNSLEGLQKLHHESYLDELDSHIRNYWNLPEWLASGNLKARVLLLINKDGVISEKSFLLKSGNDLFDQHVFNTLEKASPLPPPPANLSDFYSSKGVEIRFPE